MTKEARWCRLRLAADDDDGPGVGSAAVDQRPSWDHPGRPSCRPHRRRFHHLRPLARLPWQAWRHFHRFLPLFSSSSCAIVSWPSCATSGSPCARHWVGCPWLWCTAATHGWQADPSSLLPHCCYPASPVRHSMAADAPQTAYRQAPDSQSPLVSSIKPTIKRKKIGQSLSKGRKKKKKKPNDQVYGRKRKKRLGYRVGTEQGGARSRIKWEEKGRKHAKKC
ncbi:hypothetical protein BC940DRAFT_51457 [Gongronella butleri]|nr:hypothetical protein BC940DRAFT_51457 [Gongronella butleri]